VGSLLLRQYKILTSHICHDQLLVSITIKLPGSIYWSQVEANRTNGNSKVSGHNVWNICKELTPISVPSNILLLLGRAKMDTYLYHDSFYVYSCQNLTIQPFGTSSSIFCDQLLQRTASHDAKYHLRKNSARILIIKSQKVTSLHLKWHFVSKIAVRNNIWGPQSWWRNPKKLNI